MLASTTNKNVGMLRMLRAPAEYLGQRSGCSARHTTVNTDAALCAELTISQLFAKSHGGPLSTHTGEGSSA